MIAADSPVLRDGRPRGTCSWGRFHPDQPCFGLVWGPVDERGLHDEPITRYCDEHTEAFYAILNAPLETLGIPGLGARRKGGKGGDGHKDNSPEAQERKRRQGEALAYVTAYTGSWGLILDIRSDQRFGTKYMRLSERQVEVILAGRDRDAGRLIETQVREDDYHASLYAARDAIVNPAAPVQTRPRVVEDGMYRKDGVTYKVQTAHHGSGNRYAKRLDEVARQFIYAPGAITTLSADDRMTVEDAEAFGRLYGFCCVCAATLTDEKSIARGIGPVCGGRI